MKPPIFEYASPSTVAEAVSLLASRNGSAKVISGGQSLMPMLAFRLAAPELLVDLKHLKDLGAIRRHEPPTSFQNACQLGHSSGSVPFAVLPPVNCTSLAKTQLLVG